MTRLMSTCRMILTAALLAAFILPASASHHHRHHHHWQHAYAADLPVHFIHKVKRKEVVQNRPRDSSVQRVSRPYDAMPRPAHPEVFSKELAGADDPPIWELTKMCIDNVQEFMREKHNGR